MKDAGRGFSFVSHAAAGAPFEVIRSRGLRARFFSGPAAAGDGTLGATGAGGGTGTGFLVTAGEGFTGLTTFATTFFTAFATERTTAAAFEAGFFAATFGGAFLTGLPAFAAFEPLTAFGAAFGVAFTAALGSGFRDGFGAGLRRGFAAALFAGATAFFAGRAGVAGFRATIFFFVAPTALLTRATARGATFLRAPDTFFACAFAIKRFLF